MASVVCPKCGKLRINTENLNLLSGLIGSGLAVSGTIGLYVLPFLGFESAGVTAGSIAASSQGPAVAAGSVFAICQSLGATGLGMLLFGVTGLVVGGIVAAGLIYMLWQIFGWCTCS